MKLQISTKAEKDIRSIIVYIRQDKKIPARKFAKNTKETFILLKTFPGIGRKLSLGDEDFLYIIQVKEYKNYIIVYTVKNNIINIIRVANSRQDLSALLKDAE